VLREYDASEAIQVWIPIAIVLSLRIIAIRFDVHLPRTAPRDKQSSD